MHASFVLKIELHTDAENIYFQVIGLDISENKIKVILKINHHLSFKKGSARPLNI